MNERIAKENRMFPPKEQNPNRVIAKTQRDANYVPAHGPGPDEQHVIDRRNQIWANGAFGRRAASSKLTVIHNAEVIAKDPVLSDPTTAVSPEKRATAVESWVHATCHRDIFESMYHRKKCELPTQG